MQSALGEDAVRLVETEAFSLRRRGRFLVAQLKTPHLVLSTSQINGGQTERLRYLLNFQSCEGKDHTAKYQALHQLTPEENHRLNCTEAGVPPEATALMGTAANMQYASLHTEAFQESAVWAIATAGVQGNAGRAGDPAAWHEGESGYKPVHSLPGTINLILLFNDSLIPAGLTRAIATMTEAKSAVLQELAIGSRYSSHLATGTGTDQFCLATPLDSGRKPKSGTGKHAKLGEMIAKVVMDSIREALRWQNGLEPSRTRHLIHALGRFGIDEPGLLKAMGEYLNDKDKALLGANFQAVLHEPQVAGAAYALAAVQDRLAFGTLASGVAQELLANQAALMAAALAAKTEQFMRFRQELLQVQGDAHAHFHSHSLSQPQSKHQSPSSDLLNLVAKALALGWLAKWK